MDECASDPCLNGGSCSDGIGYYNCSCQQSYIGSRKYLSGWTGVYKIFLCPLFTILNRRYTYLPAIPGYTSDFERGKFQVFCSSPQIDSRTPQLRLEIHLFFPDVLSLFLVIWKILEYVFYNSYWSTTRAFVCLTEFNLWYASECKRYKASDLPDRPVDPRCWRKSGLESPQKWHILTRVNLT